MTPNQILDQEIRDIYSIEAKTLDEAELLKSIALFIKKSNSVRQAITNLDVLNEFDFNIVRKDGKIELSEISKTKLSNPMWKPLESKHKQEPYSGC